MEDILRNSDKKDDLQSDNEGSMKGIKKNNLLVYKLYIVHK